MLIVKNYVFGLNIFRVYGDDMRVYITKAVFLNHCHTEIHLKYFVLCDTPKNNIHLNIYHKHSS